VIVVRPLSEDDHRWMVATLEHGWGTTNVARLGELIDAALLPGFVATDSDRHDADEDHDERVGLLTYAERDDGIEVVTIQALVSRRGIGRALLGAVYALAVERRASRLWLITTNDNGAAIRFYQRWGMDLRRLIHNGVEASRLVKPSIPTVSADGIPIRHELELCCTVEPRQHHGLADLGEP
jgi:ribosomal protein S18 acetylase RimI-like enzyme